LDNQWVIAFHIDVLAVEMIDSISDCSISDCSISDCKLMTELGNSSEVPAERLTDRDAAVAINNSQLHPANILVHFIDPLSLVAVLSVLLTDLWIVSRRI
jgi:hypothetical protein